MGELFSPFGAVTQCKLLPDTGKPDRAALVRLESVEAAITAVEELNQKILLPNGHTAALTVRFKDKESPGKIGYTGSSHASLAPPPLPPPFPPHPPHQSRWNHAGPPVWSRPMRGRQHSERH